MDVSENLPDGANGAAMHQPSSTVPCLSLRNNDDSACTFLKIESPRENTQLHSRKMLGVWFFCVSYILVVE